MMTYHRFMGVLLAGLFLTGLSGCEREGPAERAGKAIDEVVGDTGEALEDAGEAIEDKKEEVEDAMEEKK